jgi:hypothetical protein
MGCDFHGTIYFDEAKVVTGAGSYEQVSVGGAKPLAPAETATLPSPAKPNQPGATAPASQK